MSGSQDCTVKVWDLPDNITTMTGDMVGLSARVTEKAHDKVLLRSLTISRSYVNNINNVDKR